MFNERPRNIKNQAPSRRRIVFTPQVPDEDRPEVLDGEVLASVLADLRPVNIGHEEDERRGPPSGFSY